ncbi:unnamed protein product [Orchesella dallaii]|uniref:Uncharacterized protein n=1 Tax=Orchesella dallaii TaxID=48710 RepID=A0ABP1RPX9_9HEXA
MAPHLLTHNSFVANSLCEAEKHKLVHETSPNSTNNLKKVRLRDRFTTAEFVDHLLHPKTIDWNLKWDDASRNFCIEFIQKSNKHKTRTRKRNAERLQIASKHKKTQQKSTTKADSHVQNDLLKPSMIVKIPIKYYFKKKTETSTKQKCDNDNHKHYPVSCSTPTQVQIPERGSLPVKIPLKFLPKWQGNKASTNESSLLR